MKARRWWVGVIVGLACCACSPAPARPGDGRLAKGHLASEGKLRRTRIVSAGGSVTETLFALGLGPRIVAVDTTSSFPPEVTKLPRVGYLRRLSGEGILSLAPTLVIATHDAGPQSVLDQLRRAGVAIELVNGSPGLAAAYERVRQVGQAVARAQEASRIVARMRSEVQQVAEAVASVARRPSVLFVYARGAGTAHVAGRGTSAQTLVELSGGRNAVEAFEGYRPLTSEAVVEADPDYLLLPQAGLASLKGVDGLLAQPGIAHTRAGRGRRVIAIDDSRLLGFGPRVASAARELARKLHPNLAGLGSP